MAARVIDFSCIFQGAVGTDGTPGAKGPTVSTCVSAA